MAGGGSKKRKIRNRNKLKIRKHKRIKQPYTLWYISTHSIYHSTNSKRRRNSKKSVKKDDWRYDDELQPSQIELIDKRRILIPFPLYCHDYLY